MRAIAFSIAALLTLNVAIAQKGLIPFREGENWGYLDIDGKVVIPARFDKTFPFKEGFGRFAQQDRFGYIKADGTLLTPNIFIEAFDFKEGLARVKDGPVWAFIDKRGKEAFTVTGEDVSDLHNGMAIFERQGFKGYVNKKGEEVFPPILTQANHFMNGVARIKVGNYYALINKEGSFLLHLADQIDYIGIPMDSVVRVKRGGYWWIFKINGDKVTRAKESISGEFSCGMAVVRVLDPSLIIWRRYMNAKGEIPFEDDFLWAGTFKHNVAVVKVDVNDKELYGVINREGNWVVDPQFTMTRGIYSEGLLGVQKGNKWGFIDTRGNWVIDAVYDNVEDFKNGYAMVSKGQRKWGLIDVDGQQKVPFKYDIALADEFYFTAILGYYKSFYDLNGDLIWADTPDKE